MAPAAKSLNSSGDKSISNDSKKENDQEQNLWGSILTEVQASSTTKLPSCKVLLVLGDNESGKTTLLAKIQGTEDPKKGSGLEYHYVDVRDEYRDDHTRLGAWVLDGDPSHSHLLKFTLTEKSFRHTTVVFCVSMMQPWSILDSLQTWSQILQDHIDRLKFSNEEIKEMQQANLKSWHDYIEPGDDLEGSSSPIRRTSSSISAGGSGDDDHILFPLGENTLTRNLGLDVVVVVTKVSHLYALNLSIVYTRV
uniref:Dynein light intermediate chain n=1 Tax=Strigamia maritima TaxID=126957 RepID=T1ISV7_STRMM